MAPAYWARHEPFLHHIGASMLWECLGAGCDHCKEIDWNLAAPAAAPGRREKGWRELPQARVSAKQFASLPFLRNSLVLLRQCMHALLSMGADAWEAKKFDFALSGFAGDAQTKQSFRLAPSGHVTSAFSSEVKRFIFSHDGLWHAVPPAERTAHASATCFPILSSLGGAAAALLQHPLERCQSADGLTLS